jgi:hypothetical protein
MPETMKRRTFFKRLLGSLGAVVASPVAVADNHSVVIQESPVAGFPFHQGEAAWPSLFTGAPLALLREPSNPHDADAVALYFKTKKLGYVPRAENRAVAQMLDRGERLEASISKLSISEDPWERIHISITLV